MEKRELEIVIGKGIIEDLEITCKNETGMVAFVLVKDGLYRVDITNGYWRRGLGWADKPVWIDRKITIRLV